MKDIDWTDLVLIALAVVLFVFVAKKAHGAEGPYMALSSSSFENCLEWKAACDGKIPCFVATCVKYGEPSYSVAGLGPLEKDLAYDLALALNEAHERRVKAHPYDSLTKEQR